MTLDIQSAVQAHASIGHVRFSIRSYYSPRLLWTAQHHAELAGEIERTLAGDTPFSIEHHGYVLSSIIASVAFLEAVVNELFQDAADERAGPDAFITPLSEDCRRLMAALWRSTREGFRLGPIERYEMLLAFAGAPSLNRGGQVYEDAKAAIALRDKLVHFRPEDQSAEDEAHAMERRLRGKFPENALMARAGNAWWPDHALGQGAAVWTHRSVKALADHVSDAIGIEPNYRRQEATGWFGTRPGEHDL